MYAMENVAAASSISAVQALLSKSITPQQDAASKISRNLALQVAHNLRFQHGWTNIHIHSIPTETTSRRPLFLLSGLPPERLYVHPDEQIALLQQQKSEGKTGMPQLSTEREWVLPSHLREKWSLQRFGEAFDGVSIVPNPAEGTLIDFEQSSVEDLPSTLDRPNSWRTTKRVLLATLDDDSTVVYYIVHDGIVKPRQN